MTVIRIDITSDWYYVRSQPTSIIHYENANGASQCSKMVNVTTNIIIMRIIKIKSCHLQSILVLDSCLVLGRWKRNRKGKEKRQQSRSWLSIWERREMRSSNNDVSMRWLSSNSPLSLIWARKWNTRWRCRWQPTTWLADISLSFSISLAALYLDCALGRCLSIISYWNFLRRIER